MTMSLVRCGIRGLASTVAVVVTVLAPGVAAADERVPSVPVNLHVQKLSFTSATVAWNASTDDSGWVMYQLEANALPRSLLRYGSTAPNKTITGLTPGVTYTLSVVAVDGARNTSAPASVQFTTPVDNTAPTTPTGLRAATVNGAVDAIAWNPATDSSSVRYALRANGNRIFGTQGTRVTAFELLYLDCVVLPGATYTLTVEALDVHDNVSGRSLPVTVTFPR
jgi:predicted phage tail protein